MKGIVTESKNIKRICVRIPINLAAEVSTEENFYRKVYINELSTTGLSFFIKETEPFPNSVQISFSLKHFSGEIKAHIIVRNRIKCPQGLRLGCVFINLLGSDQDKIADYLSRRADLSLLSNIVGMAALFCSFDALLRIAGYSIKSYYDISVIGIGLKDLVWQGPYSAVLAFYIVISFCALVLTDKIIDSRNKGGFRLGVVCLLAAFVFSAAKSMIYWKLGLESSNYFFAKVFFWTHALFVFYLGVAILTYLFYLKKINLLLGVEDMHWEHFSKSEEKVSGS
ncbi:MAG: PilZ domain-containing protein [Omnitrophica bacterium]|nr:PilZ domain-containing protein [Candidatus Omnitrophota bacterium]